MDNTKDIHLASETIDAIARAVFSVLCTYTTQSDEPDVLPIDARVPHHNKGGRKETTA